MKRALIFVSLAWLFLASTASAGIQARFMTSPTIAGDTIVFTYEGDLWAVGVAGGPARRLTNHPGSEDSARFSPDGKWVAFRAQYEGGPQIYVMPAAGGVPSRVTWFGGENMPVGWTPDGKKIVFRSSHENTFRGIAKLFAVTPDGGYPEQLPPDRATLCAFSPDGTKLAYSRKGNEEYYWKRYKGGQYVDLWLYDFGSRQFTPLTDYVGKNAYPMYAAGKLFFVSDRGANGIANIYTVRPGDEEGRPGHERSRTSTCRCRRPTASESSSCRPATSTSSTQPRASREKSPVDVATRPLAAGRRAPSTRATMIQSMAVANDGKTAVFEARGDIFLVPSDETRPTLNLTKTTGVQGAAAAAVARRHARGLLLRQDGRVPALRHRFVRRQAVGGDDDDARSAGLSPRMVAGRDEDSLRRQGLRHLLARRGDEEARRRSPRPTR